MKDTLAIIGAIISAFSTVPYIVGVIKRKTKPNVVSWFTWTLLTGIAMVAAFASHEPRTAWLMAACTFCTLMVVLLGIRYGIAKFSWFDGICQVGALVGLVLWLLFNSPSVAIIATVVIDLVAALPTMRHAYLLPEEENWQTFSIGVIAPLFTLFSLSRYNIASTLYPVYLVFANGMIVGIIVLRRQLMHERVGI